MSLVFAHPAQTSAIIGLCMMEDLDYLLAAVHVKLHDAMLHEIVPPGVDVALLIRSADEPLGVAQMNLRRRVVGQIAAA